MANTLTITREHLDKTNCYIGPDVTNYDGDIVLEPNLGTVRFKDDLVASGSIVAKRGTDIIARGSIKSGGDIIAGRSIEAGISIEAGESIIAGNGIKAGDSIKAGATIEAGWSIQAGSSIKAGEHIWVVFDIEAGDSIEAGDGIRAGLSINCKTLSARLPISAGTAPWASPDEEETQIRCEKLHGKVACGELVLKGEQEVA